MLATSAATSKERSKCRKRLEKRGSPFIRKIREAHPDKQVEVRFEDEARPGQQGTLTKVWARRGSRPRAVKQTEYRWVYLSATVQPETGNMFGMVTRRMNTLTMNDLLANLSSMLDDNRHAVLIWTMRAFTARIRLRFRRIYRCIRCIRCLRIRRS